MTNNMKKTIQFIVYSFLFLGVYSYSKPEVSSTETEEIDPSEKVVHVYHS